MTSLPMLDSHIIDTSPREPVRDLPLPEVARFPTITGNRKADIWTVVSTLISITLVIYSSFHQTSTGPSTSIKTLCPLNVQFNATGIDYSKCNTKYELDYDIRVSECYYDEDRPLVDIRVFQNLEPTVEGIAIDGHTLDGLIKALTLINRANDSINNTLFQHSPKK